MTLELSESQAQLLGDVLESEISNLSPEIADTDNPIYRRELKERREHLRAVLAKLQAAA
ncbi:MAG TPA: hypothetical protein VFW71_10920 [Actinomycetota bacterium]|nr:hypothetical protein [Actinomycetota bacterium]